MSSLLYSKSHPTCRMYYVCMHVLCIYMSCILGHLTLEELGNNSYILWQKILDSFILFIYFLNKSAYLSAFVSSHLFIFNKFCVLFWELLCFFLVSFFGSFFSRVPFCFSHLFRFCFFWETAIPQISWYGFVLQCYSATVNNLHLIWMHVTHQIKITIN